MSATSGEEPARSPDRGAIAGLAERFGSERSLAMFRQICRNRSFELETARAYDSGAIKMPIYLSLGQEHIPAAIAAACGDWNIFAQHRAHSYYLSFGGEPAALADELLQKDTGCARGMGGSASIHSPAIGMFGHSGLMGDQVPLAVGAALASGKKTLTVVGDASAEEDYIWSAMGYAATKGVPVLLICEDNDLSILTPVKVRRSWNITDIARALKMEAVDITDDPWLIAHHVERLKTQLPAVINIRTCRQLWHAGTGNDGAPEWNRFELIKAELTRAGLARQAEDIEADSRRWGGSLWAERLPKPSAR